MTMISRMGASGSSVLVLLAFALICSQAFSPVRPLPLRSNPSKRFYKQSVISEGQRELLPESLVGLLRDPNTIQMRTTPQVKIQDISGSLDYEEEISSIMSIKRMVEIRDIGREIRKKVMRQPSMAEISAQMGTNIKTLARLIVEGQEAEIAIAYKYRKLVAYVCLKIFGTGSRADDLQQEGLLGLIRAAEKFDINKGVPFRTYAYRWIQHFIIRGMQKQVRPVRYPSWFEVSLAEFRKTKEQFKNERGGQEPSEEELARKMKISTDKVSLLEKYSNLVIGSVDEQSECLEDAGSVASELLDEKMVEQLGARIGTFLEKLNKEEQYILAERYGLVDGNAKSTVEIAEARNVNLPHIKNLEQRAKYNLKSRKLGFIQFIHDEILQPA